MNFVIVGSEAPAATSDRTETSGVVAPKVSPSSETAAQVTTAKSPPPVLTPDRRIARRDVTRADRRWSQRERIERAGTITIEDSGQDISCRLSDISRFGALIELEFEAAEALPGQFRLVFVSNRVRSEADCQLRWRRGSQIGVSFEGPVRTTVQRAR